MQIRHTIALFLLAASLTSCNSTKFNSFTDTFTGGSPESRAAEAAADVETTGAHLEYVTSVTVYVEGALELAKKQKMGLLEEQVEPRDVSEIEIDLLEVQYKIDHSEKSSEFRQLLSSYQDQLEIEKSNSEQGVYMHPPLTKGFLGTVELSKSVLRSAQVAYDTAVGKHASLTSKPVAAATSGNTTKAKADNEGFDVDADDLKKGAGLLGVKIPGVN